MITVWLTGLPSAGKSTLAKEAKERLKWEKVEILDGDILRGGPLSDDLEFTREDRIKQARRTAFVAQRLNFHGVLAIVALVSPYAEARAAAKTFLPNFLEAYVKCSEETCQKRDVKGLYALARTGGISGLTGYDALYEPPLAPDIVLDTEEDSVDICTERLVKACHGHLAKIGRIV